MKKTLLTAALFVGALHLSFAQTRAGAIAIGGTLGFSTTTSKTESTGYNGTTTTIEGTKSTSIRFIPNISFFLSPKFSVGLGIGYNGSYRRSPDYNSSQNPYHLKYSNSGVVINPYAKYYISLGEKVAFFLQGDVSVNIGTSKSQYYDQAANAVRDNEKAKSQSFGIGILPGILFFPSEKIGLELSLGTPASLGNGGAYLLGYGHQSIGDSYYYTGSPYPTSSGKVKANTISFFNLNSIGVGVSVFYFIR